MCATTAIYIIIIIPTFDYGHSCDATMEHHEKLLSPFVAVGAVVALALAAWLPAYISRARAPMATPLPDLVHAVFPRLWMHVPDVALTTCLVVSLLMVYTTFPVWGTQNFAAAMRMQGYIARACTCLMVRALTVSVTTLPAVIPQMSGTIGGHDLNFSGHTIAFQAIADCWSETSAVPSWVCFVVKWLVPWTATLSRQHYTSDVIVAMAVYWRWAV